MCPSPPAEMLAAMNPQSHRPVTAALVAAGLLAAACSGRPSSAGPGGSPNSPSAVAYSGCVRSHGVPDYPGPNSSRQLPKITPANESQLGVSDSRLNAAQAACRRLWPYQAPTQAQQPQQLADDVKFAQCMRSHGVPAPDPTTGPNGPRFVISISKDGFNPRSPQVLAKARECERVMPAGWRLPPVTVTP
jgi:hypothetical protein